MSGALAALAALAITGCSSDEPEDLSEAAASGALTEGESSPISQLPKRETSTNVNLVATLLDRPTALGETTALHVRLPPPQNPQLAQSLVRIVGPADSPQVLIQTDALVRLGILRTSPGTEFFTTFATLPRTELDKLKRNLEEISSGQFGQVTNQSIEFEGRSAVATTINPAFDPSIFVPGGPFVAVNRCPVRPVSTLAAWGKSLFITAPQVVLDPARTWDPCTGAGTQGGKWTFAHLMREMSIGSFQTPENFVKSWLTLWLNNYSVNGDTVPSRTQMFNQVIQPWATASGVVATLVTDAFGVKSVNLVGGPLNLNIAPFRLNAIVNRIDLGETMNGPAGYSGQITSLPKTPGELRFIFNVVQPNPWGAGSEATCGRKPFTVIFEYGVPGTGCNTVVAWAKKWAQLQAQPGFTPAYLAQLESMTQSVVVNGAAPLKGNKNAINQIRTNEIALNGPWELREFTLSTETVAASGIGSSTPANGPLRPHTVALTPDDTAFAPFGPNATVNTFVTGTVSPAVILPVALPNKCDAVYQVPHFVGGFPGGTPFLGGNAFVGPGHWNTTTVNLGSSLADRCARHVFSLNTCGGCHRDESGTNGLGGSTSFTHITAPGSIPVTLSKFLTGGGPGLVFNVNDPQLGAPTWQFADLERRFQRLFDLSHCTSCITRAIFDPRLVTDIDRAIGVTPVDPGTVNPFPVKVGPITDLGAVQKILDLRTAAVKGTIDDTVDAVRPIQVQSH
ncbi:MAG: hypothetical protein H7138_11650 [Myxococcales bacterium]|nr:hypothetical protein [Myxococcales bacterium]